MSDNASGEHRSFIPASASVPEITVKSFLLGTLLCVVFAAANTYLGLYAGMTVSASIPAAILSMGILRGLFRSGTVLEHSIVQNFANAGETAAAGVIFTIPALLLSGVWTELAFWPTVVISIIGSLLGIVFMIPLRRAQICEDQTLKFPEAIACAQVIEAGEKSSSGSKYVIASMIIGSAFKFFSAGVSVFKGSIEFAFPVGKTAFFMGADVSPALLGVGFIVGLNAAAVIFAGGLITWAVGIPVFGAINGVEGDLGEWFWGTWATKARYLGVGTMLVAGVSSILSVRRGIMQGFSEAFSGFRKGDAGQQKIRTERNMSSTALVGVLVATVLAAVAYFQHYFGSFGFSVINVAMLLVFAFFFSAVASYICGVLGNSNSPVSGMTICAVLVIGGVLLAMGVSGTKGVFATLSLAGMVCGTCCMAGSMAQDLKVAYILGGTPSKQEWVKVFSSVLSSFAIVAVLIVLQKAYGIGTSAPGALKAPQATLFASLANGLFGNGSIPWNLIFYGVGVGIVAWVIDLTLQNRGSSVRVPLMALAVGMYLPLTLTTFLFLGGLVGALANDRSDAGSGVLFSSGLIAGESLMGVLLGGIIYFNKDVFPITVLNSTLITLCAAIVLVYMLYRVARAKA